MNFFFPVKAEMLLFSNLMTGGPRGDLQSVNFSLKFLEILKIFVDMFIFKLKSTRFASRGTLLHLVIRLHLKDLLQAS